MLLETSIAVEPLRREAASSLTRGLSRNVICDASSQQRDHFELLGRIWRATRCFLGDKPVTPEDDIVLLDDFVNACGGNGKETVLQALDPGFLPQIPERKFQVLGRASQQTFHLNDADSAPVRVTPACDIEQRQDAFTNAPVRFKTVACGSFIKNLQNGGAVLLVSNVVGGSLFRIRQEPVSVHHFIEFFGVSAVPVVGMIPFDENAKYAVDCFLLRVRVQLECFVIIPETGCICCYLTHLGSLLTFRHEIEFLVASPAFAIRRKTDWRMPGLRHQGEVHLYASIRLRCY